jgi:tRNA threonylcarbamoyl adenosine modification protein (Sua5/YciO/YrdC/YwlC family)
LDQCDTEKYMSNPVERVDITTGDRSEHLARGLKSIRDGYVIVVPLEHGYVYACDAFSHFAVRAMHVLRGDGLGVVAQVIIPNAKTAQGLSRSMRDDVQDITSAFWPGLLSVNVKPQVGLAWDLGDSGRLDQISLRMPQEGFVLELLQKSGPLAIAGITNNALPTLLDVERFENPGVDVIFDGGHLLTGPRSTVINVSDDGMELIREGAISRESLQKLSPDNFA